MKINKSKIRQIIKEEMPMRGGFHEAVAGAEIVWTG